MLTTYRTEICNFSGQKIYAGHGMLFVRGDSKAFRLLNKKCCVHFVNKKNPRKFHWTVFYRRLHRKGNNEEVSKKRARKVVKVQRAVVGTSWEQIVAQREQPLAVRQATRSAAVQVAKEKKKEEQAKKRAEKIKALGSSQRQAPKMKAAKQGGSSRVQATSR